MTESLETSDTSAPAGATSLSDPAGRGRGSERPGHRRWTRRSAITVGGAASLAIGAVLGGVLQGVPVLFPHASKVHGGTLVASDGGAVPWSLSDLVAGNGPVPHRRAPGSASPSSAGVTASDAGATTAGGSGSTPSRAGSGASSSLSPVTGAPGGGSASGAPGSGSCALCGLTAPGVPLSSLGGLPLVGPVVGSVSQGVGGVLGAAPGGLPGGTVPSLPTAAGGSPRPGTGSGSSTAPGIAPAPGLPTGPLAGAVTSVFGTVAGSSGSGTSSGSG